MKRSLKMAVALFGVGSVAITACGNSGNGPAANGGASGKTYEILAIVPLSGASQVEGDAEVMGLKAGAKVVNAHGGINGEHVVVNAVDDQGDPTQAVTDLQQALSSGAAPAMVWAGANSTETIAMLPALNSAKVLSFVETSSEQINDPTKYPYSFVMSPVQSTGWTKVAAAAKQDGSKLGIIYPNDAYGLQTLAYVTSAARQAGLTAAATSYSPTALNLTAPMQQLLAQKPDSMILSAFGPAAGYLVQARTTLGVSIPTFGDGGFAASDLSKLTPTQLNGIKMLVNSIEEYVPQNQRTASYSEFLAALQSQGPVDLPMVLYSLPYDSVQALKVAASQAHSLIAGP